MKRFCIAVLPLLALAASCGPSADSAAKKGPETKVIANTAGKPEDLFPFEKGNSWTYTVRRVQRTTKEGRQGEGETTLKVREVREHALGKEAVLDVYEEGKKVSSVNFVVGPKGVYQTALSGPNLDIKYNPAFPLLLWPIESGEETKWSGTGLRAADGKLGPIDAVITTKGEAELDTPAGRMKAFRADNVQTYKINGKEFQTRQSVWFSPKIGLVRTLDGFISAEEVRETDMKLKTYTVK